jgi:hypothetical protein
MAGESISLKLVEIELWSRSNPKKRAHFYFSIGRRARGYNRGRWFKAPGKGAMFCSRGQPKIFVLSLGSDQSRQVTR